MIRQSMADLEVRLAPASFVRIHRSSLINLEALKEITPAGSGDGQAVLKSGVRLNVGRNYRDKLLAALADFATPSADTR